ncbi:uncharacterized protein LOC132201101 [Neocloeon triangulifer]|uniref:uncharacterized protein LOC132201101 n=1 Tax=Neocloeon triangulifer TaxID=2078957 RepID=UPI00286F0044|nr:uncharacterized protein LOC132201101 [Neocloeon triangulifer]
MSESCQSINAEKNNLETLVGLLMHDCHELVNRLDDLKFLNYKIFAEVWKEMRFSMIFWRPTLDSALENAELVLLVAKDMVLPPHSLSRRLCAMYLLYGVYFKQPGEDFCKFKITHEEWVDLDQLVKFCVREELKEHVFIFCKLIEREAFEFCISPIDLVSEKHVELVRSKFVEINLPSGLDISKKYKVENLLQSPLLQELAAIEKEYNNNDSIVFTGDLEPTYDLATHLRKICISKSRKEAEDTLELPMERPQSSLDNLSISLPQTVSKNGSSKRGPGSIMSVSTLPTDGAIAMENMQLPKHRTKKPKGYAISSRTKTPAELSILLPPKGYEYIHSRNSRTLFKKTVTHVDKKKIIKISPKKKKVSGGSTVSFGSEATQSSIATADTLLSSNQSMPFL